MIKEPRRNRKKITLNREGVPQGMSSDRRKKHFSGRNNNNNTIREEGSDIEEEAEGSDYLEEGEEEVYDLGDNNLGAKRNKKETKEEKAARKRAVKEARRAARQKNKIVKQVFNSEERKVLKRTAAQKKAFQGAHRM